MSTHRKQWFGDILGHQNDMDFFSWRCQHAQFTHAELNISHFYLVLSVLCYFPIVEEQRVEQAAPQRKRKWEDSSVDGCSTDLPK